MKGFIEVPTALGNTLLNVNHIVHIEPIAENQTSIKTLCYLKDSKSIITDMSYGHVKMMILAEHPE